ncbi:MULTISPECIES: LacI family DNA-binding transcriptional regulator [unclassified Plantactinospora]|uniref:LacI family DNA-binding transcriptional regulator n=1 Tax=unclassified Plantactinospora TaxID=2631981 RepID=UPI000D16C320|nr:MULTISPECIES: LacI family DNA-binding transcriptional regulator [unclassified Plantactinospora]AVT28955.1 LacI family transcriptional regulator [Plantactinospora sp. BC1]AVT35359.1 LacI family transcriptional regulator [Plantactinospora sp. BB1]
MRSQRRDLGRPTLSEVAARAGVGRGTASRVVNNSSQVSPTVRAAVWAAVRELGYVPNRAARALVTQRTDSVALVISESGERAFGEPFFAGIARGVSAGLADTPLQLWLSWIQSPGGREKMEHQLTDQHVDGVMLISLHDADPLPGLLMERGLPTVLGGRPARMLGLGAQPAYFVDVDNAGGARQAVEYLIGIGRRTVATVAGPQDMGAGVTRLVGYREALVAHGRPVSEDLIDYGDFSANSGIEAMRRLLHRRGDIDAVFAASDLMALGAMQALHEAGRRIPADVAVVGYEDSSLALHANPPLTSVHQPVITMGTEMARLLVAQIRGDDIPSPAVFLDTHLVRRQSA